jgi:hypothetical protein
LSIRAVRDAVKRGEGASVRALRYVEALPQRPHLGGVDRGQRLLRIHPTAPMPPTPSTPPTHLTPPTPPMPPIHPDRQFPRSGKSVLSASRGARNRPPCRRGAPRIMEGPQVRGGQVMRAALANAARARRHRYERKKTTNRKRTNN